MSKEELLKEKGYDIRTMLCYFSDYRNFKKLANINSYISELIIEKPTEEEIQNFINKSYDIINKKNRD